MSGPNPIVITALGALTPVGANAEQSAAAIAAGINRIEEHAYYECTPEDPDWDEPLPLYACAVPTLDPFADGAERLLDLALPAFTEIVGKAKFKRRDLERTGLMLALPSPEVGIHALNLPAQFVPALCQRAGTSTFALWKTTQTGRTGVFTLLRSAITKLQAGDIDACIVGGVDSHLLEDRLTALDAAARLRSLRSVDGFIPGEAAAFVLLETADHARARGQPILAILGSLGEGTEPEPLTSPKQSTGQGLTQALTQALSHAPNPATVYASLNGESYFAFEWGVTLARLHESLQTAQDLVHPADSVGEIGAASGALLLVCASAALYQQPPNSAPSLLWTAGDGDHRMALGLRKG